MESKEVRVGNKVILEISGEPSNHTINHVDISLMYTGIPAEINYTGIPISEEWLTKLEVYYNQWEKCYYHDSLTMSFVITGNGLVCKDSSGYKFATVQYVHQLQNLFYAITGQEMEVIAQSNSTH